MLSEKSTDSTLMQRFSQLATVTLSADSEYVLPNQHISSEMHEQSPLS